MNGAQQEKRGPGPVADPRQASFMRGEDNIELQSLSPRPQPEPQFHPSNPFATPSASSTKVAWSASHAQVVSPSPSSRQITPASTQGQLALSTPKLTTSSSSSAYAQLNPSKLPVSSNRGDAPRLPTYKQFHPSNPFAALVEATASTSPEVEVDNNQVDSQTPSDHNLQIDQNRSFDHRIPVEPQVHQTIGQRRVGNKSTIEPQAYHAISEPHPHFTPDGYLTKPPITQPSIPFDDEEPALITNGTATRRQDFRERYHAEGFHLPLPLPLPVHLRGATPTTLGGDSLYPLDDHNPSYENLVHATISTTTPQPTSASKSKKPTKSKKTKMAKEKNLSKKDVAALEKLTDGLNLEETTFAGQKLSNLAQDDLANLLLSKAIGVKTETTVTYESDPDANQGRDVELGVVPNEWDLPTTSQRFGTTTTVEVGGKTFTIEYPSALTKMLPTPGNGPLDMSKKEVDGIEAYLKAKSSKYQSPDSDGVAKIKKDLAGKHMPMVAFENEPIEAQKEEAQPQKLRRKRNNVKKKRGGKKKNLGGSSSEPSADSSALKASRAAEELEEEGTLVGEEPTEDAETEEVAGRLSGITI